MVVLLVEERGAFFLLLNDYIVDGEGRKWTSKLTLFWLKGGSKRNLCVAHVFRVLFNE